MIVVVQCPQAPVVANASITSLSHSKFGNKTVYECHRGFYMSGPPMVVCQYDATWSNPPTCIRKLDKEALCLSKSLSNPLQTLQHIQHSSADQSLIFYP